MPRELAIALRARVTWLVAALATLLVGHGFLLAVDIYSASSRSALASVLQSREMDPLAGVTRPTLGGLQLALTLLGPLLAARSLAVEKERRTYGALCLAVGSSTRVIAQKFVASVLACFLLFVAPVLLLLAFRRSGGHVDLPETAVALGGEALHLLLVVALGLAAAAWTRTLAQAATIGICVSLTSWAIDAGDGFAALAWLGGASNWSIEQRLAPFQRGIVAMSSLAWLLVAVAAAFALSLVGGAFAPPARKGLACAGVLVVAAIGLAAAGAVRLGYDWTEQRRASLPPAAVAALRALPIPISADVFLDRDDSRRRQLETDVLAKLSLARPDFDVRFPLDAVAEVSEGRRDVGYGRIVLHAGSATRETRSTSRREIVTLFFEASGRALPDWTSFPYPGFPTVMGSGARRGLGIFAYFALPLMFLASGFFITRRSNAR